MPALVETIAFVFLLIAVGYLAVAFGLLKSSDGDGLSSFVFTLAIPLLLFRTMVEADFSGGLPVRLWLTYFSAALVTWTAAHLFIRRIMGRDARAGVVAGVSAAYSNLVLLGLPLISSLFGPEGLTYLGLIISIHLVVMLAASVTLFEWAMRSDGVVTTPPGVPALLKGFFRQLLINPLIVGILAGLAFRLSGLALPSVAGRLVDTLATVAGPVALVAVGMNLRSFGVKGHVLAAVGLSGLKLFLMPAAAMAAAWLLNLPSVAAQTAVVAASLPAGVNSWLIASRFNTGQRLASTMMTIATAAAALTTIFWASAAAYVFG